MIPLVQAVKQLSMSTRLQVQNHEANTRTGSYKVQNAACVAPSKGWCGFHSNDPTHAVNGQHRQLHLLHLLFKLLHPKPQHMQPMSPIQTSAIQLMQGYDPRCINIRCPATLYLISLQFNYSRLMFNCNMCSTNQFRSHTHSTYSTSTLYHEHQVPSPGTLSSRCCA